MSGGFQLESEPFLSVRIAFTHRNGSLSFYEQDFSPFTAVGLLKEDMADRLGVPMDQQVWHHKGRLLEDDSTLHDFDVDIDDVIEVNIKDA